MGSDYARRCGECPAPPARAGRIRTKSRGGTGSRQPCGKITRDPARGPTVKVLSLGAEGAVAMKINLEIDCTPEEVRKFFGLPEVQPLQEAVLKEVQERMTANIKAMIETWLPATLKGFEQLQQMFMARMGGGSGEKK